MPQMSPLMWVFLFFFFICFYLLLFVFIYFKFFEAYSLEGGIQNSKFLFVI